MANKKIRLIADPEAAAKAADLVYVSDDQPGIRRRRAGKGFTYTDNNGKRIKNRKTLERIKSLAIPPAYTDVWICPLTNGHIQATGRDAKGRKQYRYHPRWSAQRDETKFNRMILFGEALPTIRERVAHDLALRGLPREKVLATIVQLLGTTFIRIGNLEYARTNESFGLTTLLDEHVEISGSKVRFEFTGKSGKENTVDLHDKHLAKIIQQCQDIPGQHLFQYSDEDGNHYAILSSDVNAYLREISGQDFTAKDFRTWGGTTLAVLALAELGPCEDESHAKKNTAQMIKSVAAQLGNTRAVCRKYYVHPIIAEAYTQGKLLPLLEKHQSSPETSGELYPEEQTVMTLLRQQQ